jgi:cell shape-determining protein MreC
MSEPTHISEYIDKHMNRIKRNTKLKKLQDKYGHDVNFKQLTKQELKDWISLFNKKRGNDENNN